ncbi:helix-turn-helix domain-containing protein [Anaerorhabdus furcosa]|uniref:Transcriptional regulator, contains XRE-family HTH domain n=1 Tax=Anaerorhabdus furcosa TaxID=118967 RepID=A0A1T4LG59_9FIRM|nr:helix-turn-helix transcriptional regulator [Anaerorhabdus furcosa]SJZ53732.1 Transcriptional regulator, contains XRE-family HTH domain [Anaerorhabdus furcosa]
MKQLGNYLSTLRKEKNLTQQEVADALCVSNKTISKWERDQGYPELNSLIDLANLYGLTVDELLNCEQSSTKVDTNVALNELIELNFEKKRTISIAILFIGLLIFLGLYFLTKKFEFPFFIYLGFSVISFTFISINSYKIQKYEKGYLDKLSSWVIWFISLTLFILPFLILNLNAQAITQFIATYLSETPLLYSEVADVTYYSDLTIYLTLSNYLIYLPILTAISILIGNFLNILKNKMLKLPQKKNILKPNVIAFVLFVLSFIACSIYINIPITTKQFSPEEYTVYKDQYAKTYTGFQRLYPDEFKPFKEATADDFVLLDTYINEREICETHCNIKSFNDSKNEVVYRNQSKDIVAKFSKSLIYLNIISILCIIYLLYIKFKHTKK